MPISSSQLTSSAKKLVFTACAFLSFIPFRLHLPVDKQRKEMPIACVISDTPFHLINTQVY